MQAATVESVQSAILCNIMTIISARNAVIDLYDKAWGKQNLPNEVAIERDISEEEEEEEVTEERCEVV